jgi:hypothetical protein
MKNVPAAPDSGKQFPPYNRSGPRRQPERRREETAKIGNNGRKIELSDSGFYKSTPTSDSHQIIRWNIHFQIKPGK